MKFPILASCIIFLLWLSFMLKRATRKKEKIEAAFWEREAKANATRKQSLEDLNYILVPFESLPFDTLNENSDVQECHRLIKSFADKKTVNFTGLSNTDLKLKYGAPNIQLLTLYDHNFTQLARTLHDWASLLDKNSFKDDAEKVWEYAVSIGSDISATYKGLSSIYVSKGEYTSLHTLRETAEKLNSLMKKTILQDLDEKLSHEESHSESYQ